MSALKVRPLIMWIEDVQALSGVRCHELSSPEWRRRFRLWYDSGETVEGGAAMLKAWPWPKAPMALVGSELCALRERMLRR